MARLKHPHIVTIYDIGGDAERLYIAMELIEGPTLGELIAERGQLSWEKTLGILVQVTDALDYAHNEGILHRDLKPSNILLDGRRGVVLTDFGFAKLVGESSMSLSVSGGIVGTAAYIAPEIWDGEVATRQTDIYALACIVCEMLSGEVLFSGKTPSVVMRQHLIDGPEFPSQWPAGVPEPVSDVLGKALAREPRERYECAGDLVADLHGPADRQGLTDRQGGSFDESEEERLPYGTSVLGDRWVRPADGMVMVYVPAGEFEMGSNDGDSDEQPVHTVGLDGFWIDQTEVTNAQFAVFLSEQGNQEEGGVAWIDLDNCRIEQRQRHGEFQPKSGYADHPVIAVSWYGAAAYCEWAGARLPTEAEWEYAARGPEGRVYPWGDEFDGTLLNYSGTDINGTAPVGSYPGGASWCGALDMAGNVIEWVADWYGPYPSGPQANPTGPSDGEYRVVRGGSWYDFPTYVRAADRYRNYPDDTWYLVGFRCARGSE